MSPCSQAAAGNVPRAYGIAAARPRRPLPGTLLILGTIQAVPGDNPAPRDNPGCSRTPLCPQERGMAPELARAPPGFGEPGAAGATPVLVRVTPRAAGVAPIPFPAPWRLGFPSPGTARDAPGHPTGKCFRCLFLRVGFAPGNRKWQLQGAACVQPRGQLKRGLIYLPKSHPWVTCHSTFPNPLILFSSVSGGAGEALQPPSHQLQAMDPTRFSAHSSAVPPPALALPLAGLGLAPPASCLQEGLGDPPQPLSALPGGRDPDPCAAVTPPAPVAATPPASPSGKHPHFPMKMDPRCSQGCCTPECSKFSRKPT